MTEVTRDDMSEDEEQSSPVGLLILCGLFVLLGYFSLGALAFALALVGAVILHEFGHYATARLTGMKVTEFFVGFGPRIWSIKRGETSYGVKAIWAGAYVRIIGMNNLDDVEPDEEDRAYRSKNTRSRLLVASAGSMMHFILAAIILSVVFVGYGRTTIDEDRWSFRQVLDGGAAEVAGLEAGDRPTSVGGDPIATWEDLVAAVSTRPGETVDVVVTRDGEQITTTATIGVGDEGQGLLGVAYTDVVVDDVAIVEIPGAVVSEFGSLTRDSIAGVIGFFSPSNLADFGRRILGQDDAELSPESRPVSVVGVTDLAAEVGEDNAWNAIYLFALFNIFIGIFNLAPLPPLDGGHIVVALYERVRTRPGASRYRVDYERVLPVAYGVFAFLVIFGLGALWLDLTAPL